MSSGASAPTNSESELDDEQSIICVYWKRLIKFIDDNYFICVAFFGIVLAAAVPFIGEYPFYFFSKCSPLIVYCVL